MFIVSDELNELNKEVMLEKVLDFEELFFQNINITKKPIIIIDKHISIMYFSII